MTERQRQQRHPPLQQQKLQERQTMTRLQQPLNWQQQWTRMPTRCRVTVRARRKAEERQPAVVPEHDQMQ